MKNVVHTIIKPGFPLLAASSRALRSRRAFALGIAAWISSSHAWAQQVPSTVEPGRVPQRFQEAPQPQAQPVPEVNIEQPSMEPPPGATNVTLTVTQFQITGSTVYKPEDFNDLTTPFISKEITLADVYELASQITARYRNDGYVLSRAIIPVQHISKKDAVFKIEIIEGYVDQVIWPEGLKEHYRDFFSKYEDEIEEERPSNIETIERDLLLASDLPGLKFSSEFKPSKDHEQAATLIVTMTEKPVDLEASINNRGVTGEGFWQGTVGGTVNNVLGQHEAISVKYITGIPSPDELQYFQGTWRQVITSDGLTLTFDGSYNHGTPSLSTLRTIDYSNGGQNFDAALSYPVIRSRKQNLNVSTTAFVENTDSHALGSLFTKDDLRGLRASAEYDRSDSFGGTNLFQLTFSRGIDGFGSTDNGSILSSRTGSRVDFTKLEATVSRTQGLDFLTPNLSAYGSAYGQYAWDALPTAEECSYGGRLYGRAVDPSTLIGDNCVDSSLELRYDLSIAQNPFHTTQLYTFADQGFTDLNLVSAGTPRNRWGSSAGFGLRLGWRSDSKEDNDNLLITTEAAGGFGGDISGEWSGHVAVTARY